MEGDLFQVHHGPGQHLAGERFLLGVVDEDVNAFASVQVADDLGVYPRDGFDLAGPVVGVMRPGEPGRGMRLPFGRHPEDGIDGRSSFGDWNHSALSAGRRPRAGGIPPRVKSNRFGLPAIHFVTIVGPSPGRPTGRQPSVRPFATQSAQMSPSKTVLVIDDDPGVRETLQVALEDQGYVVLAACDGETGFLCPAGRPT